MLNSNSVIEFKKKMMKEQPDALARECQSYQHLVSAAFKQTTCFLSQHFQKQWKSPPGIFTERTKATHITWNKTGNSDISSSVSTILMFGFQASEEKTRLCCQSCILLSIAKIRSVARMCSQMILGNNLLHWPDISRERWMIDDCLKCTGY